MEAKKIKINGFNLQVYFWGIPDNPKLFLFHGWMDSGASFHFICELLKKNFYCIAPDLRGFGQSDHTSNPLGYYFLDYLTDVQQLLEYFDSPEKARVLGHSMGGNLLSLYCGIFPKSASHFINIEGLGPQGHPPQEIIPRIQKWLKQINSFEMEKGFRWYNNEDEIANRLQMANPQLILKRAKFLIPFLSKKKGKQLQFNADPKHKWIHPYIIPLEQYEACWKNISAKCLFIIGENTDFKSYFRSTLSAEEEVKRRLKNFPVGIKKHVVKGAGHMIHHEKPRELANIVEKFLQEKD